MNRYNTVVENNRICYVDPNDVRDNINGVPLTPDYTGFNIWCNLIVEPSSRLKNNGDKDDDGSVFMYQFDMTNPNAGFEYKSFMRGKDADTYNFLTTDYTNIDYGTVKERSIVEGLQIENINIAFTNYQTPQVTIKFVDIRGGGFFGREEATHSEYGGLSGLEEKNSKIIDNFYSCFVSFPYPRFKLQVKGFYGRDVTYQLTCTNFSGNLNSQTGNFEITVQFIGYEYGILGDIPFDLLVAAPMTPDGEKYWNEHVNNDDWLLYKGNGEDKDGNEQPIKLYDFYNNISNQLSNYTPEALEETVVDNKTAEKLIGIISQSEQLTVIKDSIRAFKDSVRKVFKQHYVTECVSDTEDIIILHSPTEVFTQTTLLNEMCDKRNRIGELVEEYNKSFGGFPWSAIPNNRLEKSWERWSVNDFRSSDLTFTELVNHCGNENDTHAEKHRNLVVALNTSNQKTNNAVNGVGSFVNHKIYKLFTNETYVITNNVSSRLYDTMTLNKWAIYGKDTAQNIAYAKYVSVIDLGNANAEISKKLADLKSAEEEYKKDASKVNGTTIKEILGFTPYVGRYFKVVMCHLETFVYLFYQCADRINDEMFVYARLPEKLGISKMPIETDVPSMYKQVPPFPAVYRKYSTVEGRDNENVNDESDVKKNVWLGDFKGPTDWREEKLVTDFYLAAQKIKVNRIENDSNATPAEEVKRTSLLPIDYIFKIPNYAYSTLDGLKFYAGVRAYIMLHLMGGGKTYTEGNNPRYNTEDCRLLGMYNAYVYLSQKPGTVSLKDLVGGENLTKNGIYDSLVYDSTFKAHKPFGYEESTFYYKRNPLFIKRGNKLIYNYIPGKDNASYIPLHPLESLVGRSAGSSFKPFFKTEDSAGVFEPKDPDDENFLYTVGNTNETHTKTHHFEIISEDDTVNSLKEEFSDFKNGAVIIGDQTSMGFADALEAHLKIDDERYKKFYKGTGTGVYKERYSDDRLLGTENVEEFTKGKSFDTIKNKFLTIAR